MEIMAFEQGHIDALVSVYVDVFAGPPWHERWEEAWVRQRLACVAQSPNAYGLVVASEGSLIGAILGRGIPFKSEMHFEIVECFIAPRDQGQGIGTRLLHELERLLQLQGYALVFLGTSVYGDPPRFYQRNGYARLESIQLMTKSL
jgi:GNAT superfamily N-acetyltransferase|tara:strand:- start:909 stop:1346 length:438 start_codon:yes stop_codon:yes gene_type:complete